MNSSETVQTDSLSRRRKSVSFPSPPSNIKPNGAIHSPAHEKILSRKPTPYNNDLSDTIRRNGLDSITSSQTDQPGAFPAIAAAAAVRAVRNELENDQKHSSDESQDENSNSCIQQEQAEEKQLEPVTSDGTVNGIDGETAPMESG